MIKLSEIEEIVQSAARGNYQRLLVDDRARWDGNDLRGRAKQWASRCYWSRIALARRIDQALPEGWTAAIKADRTGRAKLAIQHDFGGLIPGGATLYFGA